MYLNAKIRLFSESTKLSSWKSQLRLKIVGFLNPTLTVIELPTNYNRVTH